MEHAGMDFTGLMEAVEYRDRDRDGYVTEDRER